MSEGVDFFREYISFSNSTNLPKSEVRIGEELRSNQIRALGVRNLVKSLSKCQNLTSLNLDFRFTNLCEIEASDVILINQSIITFSLEIDYDIFGLNLAQFIE
ncbi:hypothetical protein ABPG72_017581 [Tetrahymena utriculariae]